VKNIVTVLALVLILAVSIVGNAYALRYPYNDPATPGGDDHPWGGGNDGTSNPSIVNGGKTLSLISTGNIVFDFIVTESAFSTTYRSIFFPTVERQIIRHRQIETRNFNERGAR